MASHSKQPGIAPPVAAAGEEAYARYQRLLKAAGAELPHDGQALVIGLRGITSGGTVHPTEFEKRFDDVFVVMRPDGRAVEFRGSTHPTVHNADDSTDADGDGVPDVGLLRPGHYRVEPRGDYKGAPGYDVMTLDGSKRVPGFRTTEHLGIVTDAEQRASEIRGDMMTGILFHLSGRSTGCQMLEDYPRFVEEIGGPDAVFHCELLDVSAQAASRSRLRPEVQEALLGEARIPIVHMNAGPGPTFLHLHQDEKTSAAVARLEIESAGGRLIDIPHGGGRLVEFSLDGTDFTFDPNRIFTEAGARDTLARYGPVSDDAVKAVRSFAELIVQDLSSSDRIISMHNNRRGPYSAESYLPGGPEAASAARVHLEPGVDRDKFFLVTEDVLFESLSRAGQNVILQRSTPQDDGSLSVYAAAHQIPYVLIEAGHGAFAAQERMVSTLRSVLPAV